MHVLSACVLYEVDVVSVINIEALFSSQKFSFFATVALSFLFDKHYPITE